MHTLMPSFARIMPFLSWLHGYGPAHFRADFFAGLTVALVLIPQSMAYAQLAGLPAHSGLYATSLEPLATAGSDAYIAYAVLLALVVGIAQFLLGALRLGLLVNFLSHPVVIGFTNAAAIIIALSQVPKLFGIMVEGGGHPFVSLFAGLRTLPSQAHWPTLAMAVLALGIMVGLRRFNARIPNILVAVILTTVFSWAIGYERQQRVGLDQIAASGVRDQIGQLNRAVAEIERLTAQRVRLTAEIGRVEQGPQPDRVMLLGVRYRQDLLGVELDQAKRQAQQLRASLRTIRFVEKEGAEGRSFSPWETGATAASAQGSIWRLKVGNGPLRPDALPLAGGGAVIGAIPGGLPDLRIPRLDLNVLSQLFPYAIIISLLGFMESISIARAMAARTGQKLDANQELIGQGLANIMGSFSGGYAVSGSFSRSAVNLQAGGVTGLANVFSALFVLVTLLLFTPLLYHLPQAVLAVIIIMAVAGLIQVKGIVHAWKAQKSDGVIAVTTFVSTLAFAPHLDKGIGLGVALSLAVFLHNKMRPKVATLAMSQEGTLQCADEHRLRLCAHIAAVRFDGTLFFANASFLDEQVFRIRSANPELRFILLVADGINDMDASGEEALALLVERVRSAGLGFALCRVKENVMAVLRRTGLLERIGAENIYPSEEAALAEIIEKTHQPEDGRQGGCIECPLVHHRPRPFSERHETPKGFLVGMDKARKVAREVVGSMAASV
ncbi:MAG: SulP family inorganic anion transporter [Thermodesulfobacteriota bacterium]